MDEDVIEGESLGVQLAPVLRRRARERQRRARERTLAAPRGAQHSRSHLTASSARLHRVRVNTASKNSNSVVTDDPNPGRFPRHRRSLARDSVGVRPAAAGWIGEEQHPPAVDAAWRDARAARECGRFAAPWCARLAVSVAMRSRDAHMHIVQRRRANQTPSVR